MNLFSSSAEGWCSLQSSRSSATALPSLISCCACRDPLLFRLTAIGSRPSLPGHRLAEMPVAKSLSTHHRHVGILLVQVGPVIPPVEALVRNLRALADRLYRMLEAAPVDLKRPFRPRTVTGFRCREPLLWFLAACHRIRSQVIPLRQKSLTDVNFGGMPS